MYETETNLGVETSDQLPREIARAFGQVKKQLESRTVLPWSEHCTECVWPSCYSTCDLYSARPDGGCRRFADGMVRVDLLEAVNAYVLKIRFKRWGKLWTPGNVRLHSTEQAGALEKRDHRIGRTLQRMPLPSLVKITAAQKRYGFKKRQAVAGRSSAATPTCFLIECFNPEERTVALSLTMRALDERSKIPFQKLIELTPGFHCIRIPFEEIAAPLDVQKPFGIDLTPNDESNDTTLYFGLMEFVTEVEQAKTAEDEIAKISRPKNGLQRKVKCVVWDLDNTLWDGVLVEDGVEKLRLKPGMAEVIRQLDDRGILQSIASKNNADDALRVVKKFQLDEYFLCPQISWGPKSQGLKAIAQGLNIGLDSLLFLDDSAFELEEVSTAYPEVRTLRAEEYRHVARRADCDVPVSDESRNRRKLYQVEAGRQNLAQSFSHDYMAFLRHCEIRLTVRPMTEENLERVHELTQRTNQMNFSGNRYDREILRKILSDSNLDTFVLSCEDRFGSYGVIGFSLVDRREPRMTDLMFSCRIQSKRVEHAFLACVIRKYIEETGRDFHADFRQTPRNAPSGKVFADMGMNETEKRDGVSRLVFRKDQEIRDDGVIQVAMESALQETSA